MKTGMVPAVIIDDIGPLLARLQELGVRIVDSECSQSFGNYYVDLQGPRGSFRITRDKGQYFIDDDIAKLRRVGLFRAFDALEE